MGPKLFCLAVQNILSNSKAAFRTGYLDDLSLGGDLHQVADKVDALRTAAADIGLSLNESKCELIAASPVSSLPSSLSGFQFTVVSDSTMLGTPLLHRTAMNDL